jgi:prepilin-type N-terminal cleavage/methylation domain-containing protein
VIDQFEGIPTDRQQKGEAMPRRSADEDGFTLLEVLVAMAVIGTVMAGVAPFLVRSLAVVNQQRSTQVAVQVANDALERVHALDPESLTSGRSAQAAKLQLTAAPPKVIKTLGIDGLDIANFAPADPMLPDTSTDGLSAPLPTVAMPVTTNGTTFQRQWFIIKCSQVKVTVTALDVGSCLPLVQSPVAQVATGPVFFKVVVSVTWPDKFCDGGTCTYVANTMVSTGTDPIFDSKTAAPTVIDPVAQKNYVGDTVSLQIVSTGGTVPLTWSVTGLPAGLTMSNAALVTGTPTTAGTYSVTVKTTDKEKRNDDSTFTWTVVAIPVLTSPGNQLSRTNAAVSLQPVATGGFTPMVWTATNLPAGLAMDPATGLITGTPTTAKTTSVTLTVTDSGATPHKSSVTFTWQVLTPVQLYDPGPQTMTNGTNVGTFTPYAFGGLAPYSWQVQNLPDGAKMDPVTGKVTGIITHGTRYLTTVTVTDAAGGTATLTVVCTVNPSSSTDLKVTAPAPANPDQTTAVNTAVSLSATALGADSASYTWSATGLPTGLSISTNGKITGTPAVRGTYPVKLTVKSTGTTAANLMFVWSVT